jgi:thioredoxin-disulfide reductase
MADIMYDTIIIGSGPAGLTAAIYATRRELKTLVIGRDLGGQLIWAGDIENYPGFININNFDLIMKFKDQVVNAGVEINNSEVNKIEKQADNTFRILTNKEEFRAKTIIITIGLSPRRLAVPGEIELNGKGVSYCANCDGPLYRNKEVAVIGAGNSAFDAAEVLSKIAKKVYLLSHSDKFKAFDSLIEEVKSRNNIEIVVNANIKEIIGKERVEKVVIADKDTLNVREINIDGVFIEIGRIAATDLVADLVDRDKNMQIIANNRGETKTAGVYAAGDVTNISEFKQISIATGQATIAALAAYQYLQVNFK